MRDEAGRPRPNAPIMLPTHEVTNQPPPLLDYDPFACDRALVEAIERSEAAWAVPALHLLGRRAGSAEAIAWGFEANRYPPTLLTYDRFGRRIDEVEYHPSYHRLMEVAIGAGLHCSSWREPKPGANAARAAAFYLWSQVEVGHGCPISMTYAAVPALRAQPELAAKWEPLVFAATYDSRLRDAREKGSALFGMAMTEKQGGSDVRANTTRAEPAGTRGPGCEYRLTGHKWFCSAPMCDAFLVLAQAPGGLSCFLLPRILPDGRRNTFLIQRLKDKLGNRSNASSEVEFADTSAWLVGEEGRGIQTIVEMVNFTRLDCALGSAAGMRHAVVQAIHHARHRKAFGKLLVEQPLMQNVLADLALESEAATLLVLRLAEACDRAAAGDAREAAFKRIGTALAKYWICKRTAPHAAEALECLGGNGYVEESIMPRLVRESPLNSLWEGAGNVNALDVLRAAAKEPETLDGYFVELEPLALERSDAVGRFGAEIRSLSDSIDALRRGLPDAQSVEYRARRLVERMAVLLQAALLVRNSPSFVAEAFCATRLDGDWGRAFGTLPTGCDVKAIVDRAFEPRD